MNRKKGSTFVSKANTACVSSQSKFTSVPNGRRQTHNTEQQVRTGEPKKDCNSNSAPAQPLPPARWSQKSAALIHRLAGRNYSRPFECQPQTRQATFLRCSQGLAQNAACTPLACKWRWGTAQTKRGASFPSRGHRASPSASHRAHKYRNRAHFHSFWEAS